MFLELLWMAYIINYGSVESVLPTFYQTQTVNDKKCLDMFWKIPVLKLYEKLSKTFGTSVL